jgi:hypothetical protein
MIFKKLSIWLLLSIILFNNGLRGESLSDKRMITVKRISFPCSKPPARLIEKMLDSTGTIFHKIDNINWAEYPYKPDVQFRIAYSIDEIFLQFKVEERYIRAIYTNDDGSAPYKDSCVEFFIIPGSDSVYYNLELNCIGIGTFAKGADRRERTRFDSTVTSRIRRTSTLGNSGFDTKEGDFKWSIIIAIPIELFNIGSDNSLRGRVVKANFYKCGDDLPERHYLTWNPVGTEKPDFHRPEFFGDLYFEK